jgi:hypothetical protein
MPSWTRSWANFSLLWLYSDRNTQVNLHILGQPNSFLALGDGAGGDPPGSDVRGLSHTYLNIWLARLFRDTLCPQPVWSAECLSWSILTRAHAPRQVEVPLTPPPRKRTAAAASVRCVWSFRVRYPVKDWRFPSKLSKSGPENSKRIVGLGRTAARHYHAWVHFMLDSLRDSAPLFMRRHRDPNPRTRLLWLLTTPLTRPRTRNSRVGSRRPPLQRRRRQRTRRRSFRMRMPPRPTRRRRGPPQALTTITHK